MLAAGKELFMLYVEKAVSVFRSQACVQAQFNLTGIFGILGRRSVLSLIFDTRSYSLRSNG
jgi:hypothetical protein